MRIILLVHEMIELRAIVDVCTVSCSSHSAPNYVSGMSICLNVSKFHARNNFIWNKFTIKT